MAASIAEYLLTLARDPDAVARHQASEAAARSAMTDAGLSEEQQEIVLSRDPERISEAIRSELSPASGGIPIFIMFTVFPPHDA